MEIPSRINIYAAKYAQDLDIPVALDCGGDDIEISPRLMVNLDYISPNETEL